MTVGFVRGAALGVAALPIPCCGLFVLLAAVGVAAAAPAASCCGNCPSCLWRARKDARVRREVRDLSGAEWRRVTTAMNTMKRVATTEGQASYGAVYRSCDYFTAKHYAASIDKRGNGAHYGPQFATWHAALGLEFERALLAVDPAIEALPYWGASETSPSVFRRTYFGSAPGDGEDHDVVDGPFGSWRVPQHKALADYAPATSSFAASTAIAGNAAGYLRHPDSMTSVSGVVRFGGDYRLLRRSLEGVENKVSVQHREQVRHVFDRFVRYAVQESGRESREHLHQRPSPPHTRHRRDMKAPGLEGHRTQASLAGCGRRGRGTRMAQVRKLCPIQCRPQMRSCVGTPRGGTATGTSDRAH